jgi:pimeloyl-ACP methyl ester carboxylesterase
MFRIFWLLSLALILAACQGFPFSAPTATPTITPVPTATLTPTPLPTSTPTPFPEAFTSEVKVGDYHMKITCKGTGEPTIIMENGMDYPSWSTPRFSKISRTCIYPRVGMGNETAKGPRTTLDQVNDLHELLRLTGIPGPYILVGHSIGGYNVLLYTYQYPEEVVGLVCVDCRYPVFVDLFIEKLKAAYADDPDADAKIKQQMVAFYVDEELPDETFWPNYKEKVDYYKSAIQVREVTSLGDRPFVVLVADYTQTALSDEWIYFNNSWNEGQVLLSQLSTQGKTKVVYGTTHLSILYHAVVTEAIQEVYDTVTNP